MEFFFVLFSSGGKLQPNNYFRMSNESHRQQPPPRCLDHQPECETNNNHPRDSAVDNNDHKGRDPSVRPPTPHPSFGGDRGPSFADFQGQFWPHNPGPTLQVVRDAGPAPGAGWYRPRPTPGGWARAGGKRKRKQSESEEPTNTGAVKSLRRKYSNSNYLNAKRVAEEANEAVISLWLLLYTTLRALRYNRPLPNFHRELGRIPVFKSPGRTQVFAPRGRWEASDKDRAMEVSILETRTEDDDIRNIIFDISRLVENKK